MEQPKPIKSDSFLESTNNAILGIINSFKHERNLRIHFVAAILILLIGLWLQITKMELVILLICVTFVFMSEMINTAIENLTDAFIDKVHPAAKLAKDVCAGAVLISVIGSSFVGYLIFFDHLKKVMPLFYHGIKVIPLHLALITLVMVMIMTVIIKTLSPHGTPLRGGMPSGHTALAFATATVVLWFVKDLLVVSAVFLLAAMVAQSRVETKAHGWWEVILGGLWGFLFTLILFRIFMPK